MPHVFRMLVNSEIFVTEIQESDQKDLIEKLKDKDIYNVTLNIPYPYTPSDAKNWVETCRKERENIGQPLTFAIRLRSNDELIGGVGFNGLTLGKSHRAEFGYWLAKAYWGHGIMTAVAKKVCAHGFENLGLEKIHANVFLKNQKSIRVLEKCGFVREGTLRKHYQKEGKFYDGYFYGLLKEEFKA